jgi:hypothetical protein
MREFQDLKAAVAAIILFLGLPLAAALLSVPSLWS